MPDDSVPLQTVTWKDVRASVIRVNPELGQYIDEFNPGSEYKLFKARYSFGNNVVEQGVLKLPIQGGRLVTLENSAISDSLRNDLNYASIPLGLWLNKRAEVFVEMDDRVIPINIFNPGDIFGLWESLDPPNGVFSKRIWSLSAGIRSLFMLPKITEASGYARLQRQYNLHLLPSSRSLFEQAKIFSEIVNSEAADCRWFSEVLFFSKKWLEEQLSNKAWLRLYYHMLKNEWLKSLYWRNKVTFELMGQAFATAQDKRNLKTRPYLIDTVMYLISLGVGCAPGFIPIVEDELAGPIQYIQKVYVETYGLKHYFPTIMRAQYLIASNASPIYYSMQLPTALASAPQAKNPHSVLEDLRTVKLLLETLRSKLKSDNTPIYSLIEHVRYDFFHTEADKHNDIKETRTLPERDPRLIQGIEGRIFCETSPFLRGCVCISLN